MRSFASITRVIITMLHAPFRMMAKSVPHVLILNSIIEWENVNRNKHIPNYDVWEKCHWKGPPPHWQGYEEVMEIGHWASQWRFESSNSTCDSYLNREWEATILRKINEIKSEGCEWTQTPLYLKIRFYFFEFLDFKQFKIASWHYTHVG